jgi:hypothetical protein
MVLDSRLAKLARGVTVAEAARAHSRSQTPGELRSEPEPGQAAEFEAVLDAMFLVAAVDGEISEQELEQLRASVQAIVDLHVVSGGRVQALLAEFNNRLAREGWHARLASLRSRIPTRKVELSPFDWRAAWPSSTITSRTRRRRRSTRWLPRSS